MPPEAEEQETRMKERRHQRPVQTVPELAPWYAGAQVYQIDQKMPCGVGCTHQVRVMVAYMIALIGIKAT